MVVVGAVEGQHYLAKGVVAEEGADLLHLFLAVVAEVVEVAAVGVLVNILHSFQGVVEVVGDLCSAIAVEDLRSVTVVEVVEVTDLAHPFREVVAAVGVLVSILHLFQGVVEVVGDLYNLEEEAVEVELQY